MAYDAKMLNDNTARTIAMGLISTDVTEGTFEFEMQAKHNSARTVKFSIDQVDARTLYEALCSYLQAK